MPRELQAAQRKMSLISALVLVSIAIIVSLSYLASGKSSRSKEYSSTLILAQVLFRHGDRTPTESYPNDPYNDASFWPGGWGALTTLGKSQLYELGASLRERYTNFVSEIYSAEEIYMMSSDHDRCLMSAQLFLTGFYPPRDWQIWKENLNWQPIPVHTVPRNLDQLIVVKKPCPRYEEELERAKSSPEVLQINEEQKMLYLQLSVNTGKKISSILDVEMLYNTLEIEEKNEFKLPPWVKAFYPEPTRLLAAKSLALFTHNDVMKRLKGGPLLNDMRLHMMHRSARKAYFYSGHDLTIVSFLRALGLNQTQLKPDPADAVLLELHQSNQSQENYVELFYKKNNEDAKQWEIPDCPKPCLLDTFLEITEQKVPNDWDVECLEI